MFSDPIQNLKQLGLRDDMIVADLGAGTGFYSIAAAHMVPRGKVYAIEIQKDFLETINNKTKELNLKNLEAFWCDIEEKNGTHLKDNIVDVVIVSNVIFQAEDKDAFIKEAKRILKNDGRMLFVDWSPDSRMFGEKKGHFISKEDSMRLLEDNGFSVEREIDAGVHHYGFIFKINK